MDIEMEKKETNPKVQSLLDKKDSNKVKYDDFISLNKAGVVK